MFALDKKSISHSLVKKFIDNDSLIQSHYFKQDWVQQQIKVAQNERSEIYS